MAFEQELYDRMAQKKMDEDNKKGIHAVTSSGKVEPQTDDKQEYTEIWSEEWGCYLCGLAVKRGREEEMEEDASEKKQKVEPPGSEEDGKGKGKGKRGPRPVGPCWSCGGAHFQRDCPKGAGKGPTTAAWSSWRPGSFPGPSPQQWRGWFPSFKGKGKGKGKGGKGKGKGKGQGGGSMGELGWGPTAWGPPIGQLQQQPEDSWTQVGPAWGGDICMVKHVQPTATSNMFKGLETEHDLDDFPNMSIEVPVALAKKMPKMPPKKLCKKVTPGKRFLASGKRSLVSGERLETIPENPEGAIPDDCKGPLVKKCRCKQGNCTAHRDFKQFSGDMQQIRKLEKAYSETELKQIATAITSRIAFLESEPALAGKVVASLEEVDPKPSGAVPTVDDQGCFGDHLNVVTEKEEAVYELAALKREMCLAERSAERAMSHKSEIFDEPAHQRSTTPPHKQ